MKAELHNHSAEDSIKLAMARSRPRRRLPDSRCRGVVRLPAIAVAAKCVQAAKLSPKCPQFPTSAFATAQPTPLGYTGIADLKQEASSSFSSSRKRV